MPSFTNRRANRYNSNNDHLQSPYSRGPSSPHPSKISVPKTPGSIFTKVKQMFSPTTWISESADVSKYDDSEVSIVSNSQEPFLSQPVSRSVTPSNPFKEFKRVQSNFDKVEESPNVKLAKFFANKGNEPLSEIELEGVRALLAKSQSTASSPNNSNIEVDDSFQNTETNDILKPQDSKTVLNTTPSFKATYNTSVSEAEVGNSSIVSNLNSHRKKRVFDYSGFPSPYRTSRLKNYLSLSDLQSSNNNAEVEKKEINSQNGQAEAKQETTKKLSSAASTLLSFIENHESQSSEDSSSTLETTQDQNIDFSNPYASARKHKKASPPKQTIKKQTAVEKLERSLEDASAHHEIPSLNKYKPTKSSSLRESVSLDEEDETDSNASKQDVSIDEGTQTVEESKSESKINPDTSKVKLPAFSFTSSTPAAPKSFNTSSGIDTITKPFTGTIESNDKGKVFESSTKPNAVSRSTIPSFSFASNKNDPVSSSSQSTTPQQTSLFSFNKSENKESQKSSFNSNAAFGSNTKPTESLDVGNASSSFGFKQPDKIEFGAQSKTIQAQEDEDEDMDKSLTIRPSGEVTPSTNGYNSPSFSSNGAVFSSQQSLFRFPDAAKTGYSLADTNEEKTIHYRSIFTF